MDFLKVKTEMPTDGATAKIKILENLGVQAPDKWGNTPHRFRVLVNDQRDIYWDASAVALKGMRDIGANEVLAEFMLKRSNNGEKSYFNCFPLNDINVQPQNLQPKPTPAKDDMQERIIKGMCFNNACTLSKRADNGVDMSAQISHVKAVSQALYKEMKSWLEGKEVEANNDLPTEVVPEDLPF